MAEKNSKTPKGSPVAKSEMSVCGTGKHRVININPLLLTPMSVSKIYNGKRKDRAESKRSARSRQIFTTQQNHSGSAPDLQKQVGEEDLYNPQIYSTTSPTSFFDQSVDFNPRVFGTVPSVAESEISLSSNVTTDDISSIADSEMTDVSELAAYTGLVNSGIFLTDTPKISHFNSTTSEDSLNQFDKISNENETSDINDVYSTKNEHEYQSKTTSNPETPKKFSAGDAPENPYRLISSNRSDSNPRRERTIEISPTLMLPVTSVSGVKQQKELTINNRKEESSTSPQYNNWNSMGDSSMLDSLETTKIDENSDSKKMEDLIKFKQLQAECRNLRQSLKLSDADIAILVSSKQELQLKFHEQTEEKKSLSKIIVSQEEKCKSSELKGEQLEKSLLEKEEIHQREIIQVQKEMEKLRQDHDTTVHTLDVTRAERDSGRIELNNMNRNVEIQKMKLQQLENELHDVTTSNLKLESTLQETSMKGEGNETYINHLKQERSECTRKLQEIIQENKLLHIQNKTQESKIIDLTVANKDLEEKVTKVLGRIRESEMENGTLANRLKSASKEKTELNGAVARLRLDLSKVEASFMRLKQQMIEKSHLAESESLKREQLEEEVKTISLREAKLNEMNTEIRIRDKNVQIEQLLTKCKSSTQEKSSVEKKVTELQSHISENEKSWVLAVEREKRTAKLLEEKERICDNLSTENREISKNLKLEELKSENLSFTVKETKSELTDANNKLKNAQESIEKLVAENNSISVTMEKMRKQLQEEQRRSELESEQRGEENLRLRNDISQLTTQIEALQRKVLSQEEELRSLESKGQHESDDTTIHQMELLSELQSARRELSQEKDVLLEENTNIKSNLEILKVKIQDLERELKEQTEREKNILQEKKGELDLKNQELENVILLKEKQLKDHEKSKRHLGEELVMINDHNNILSQQFGALRTHNGKLSVELESKVKELDDSRQLQHLLKEEMEILKQELSSVTLQLSDVLRKNKTLEESTSVSDSENLIRERDLLKDAVMKQQQYATSLQKHYEKWAKDAGNKMKEEISKIRMTAEEERSRFSEGRKIQEEQIVLMEKKIKDNHLIVNNVQTSDPKNQIRMTVQDTTVKSFTESSTQTDHDKEPLIPWSQNFDESLLSKEEVNILKHGVDTQLSKISQQEEKLTKNDDENLRKERDLLKDTVTRQQHYAASLQKHYEEWARDAGSKMKEEIARVRKITEDENLHQKQEKEEQEKLIESQKEIIEGYHEKFNFNSVNTGTQTSHVDTMLKSLSENNESDIDRTDSSTQTDHSEETVVKTLQESKMMEDILERGKMVEEEKLLLVQENEHQAGVIAALRDQISQLSTPSSNSKHLQSDIITSTDSSNLLEDSSTQTDHNMDPIVPHYQDAEKMREEILELRTMTEEERYLLMEENANQAQVILKMEQKISELSSTNTQSDSSTQTDHNEEALQNFQDIPQSTEESSTQTDHDAEPILLLPQDNDEKKNQEISEAMSNMQEEKCQLEQENKKQAETIAVLEGKIKSLASSQEHEYINAGMQTSHSATPLHLLSNLNSSDSTLLEDSSTQTDHDCDLATSLSQDPRDDRRKEKILQLEEEEERCHLMREISNQAQEIALLKEQINGYSSHLLDNASTQTNEKEFVNLPAEKNLSLLTEDSSTQTDHDKESIIPCSNSQDFESNKMMKEEMWELRKMGEEERCHLEEENLHQAGVVAALEEKIKILSSIHACIDANTQTSHEDTSLSSLSEDLHSLRLKEELELAREELSNANSQLHEACLLNERLSEETEENKNVNNAGTQTDHDDVPIHRRDEIIEAKEIETCDSSVQTDHNLLPVGSPVWSQSATADITLKHALVQTENGIKLDKEAQTMTSDPSQANLQNSVPIVSNEISENKNSREHYSPQNDMQVTKDSGKVCPTCGLTDADTEVDIHPPSPMTILRTMESRKLKAYKKTVHLLKKKLQEAEIQINDLKTELNSLSSSLQIRVNREPAVFGSFQNPSQDDDDVTSHDKRELAEQNDKAMEEIKLLQHEIYEIKKSAALQAEDTRRKSLGERKISEAKLSNMSERISGLTDANKRLRDNVDKLQVKLSEKTKVGDIAQKEKQRYQLRARRLQANLRSLAWISGKQETSSVTEYDSDIQEQGDDSNPKSELEVAERRKSSSDRASLSLPASVIEIEESLKDLQNEIISLERQMQEHNSAVKKSKNQWSRLKESNLDDTLQTPEHNPLLNPCPDEIAEISQVI